MKSPYDAEMLVRAVEALERERAAVERQEAGALVRALELMHLYGIPMPDWLGVSVGAAIWRYTQHEFGTLDEAFLATRPAGYRRPAAASRARLGRRVARDIQDMVHAGAVIDDSLFEAVGNHHGIGKTRAKKWFYDSVVYAIERPKAGGALLELPAHLDALRPQVNWKADHM